MKVVLLLKLACLLMLTGSDLYAQWSRLPGDTTRSVRALSVTDSVIGAAVDTSFHGSNDRGNTWSVVPIGKSRASRCRALVAFGNELHIGVVPDGDLRSTDHGRFWAPVTVHNVPTPGFRSYVESNGYLYASVVGGVLRLSDTGWALVSAELGSISYALAGDLAVMFIGNDSGELFVSDDSLKTWRKIFRIGGWPPVVGLYAQGDSVWLGNPGGGLFYSYDRGVSWDTVDFGANKPGVVCIVRVKDLLLAGSNRGIQRSLDNGKTWQYVNEGFPGSKVPTVLAIAQHRDTVFVGTSEWIWKRPLSELLPQSGVESPTGVRATTLGQSIPNPTRHEVSIPYALAAGGPVTLTVYDAILQEVRVVVDAQQEAGPHTARFSTENLPSGVYYYRLNAGGLTLNKRMVVLR